MIPNNNLNKIEIFANEKSIDRTFLINENQTVYGFIEGKRALRQWVRAALSTERYKYEIFSWNFGLEIEDLYGLEPSYVMSELKARIIDALMPDDRIEDVCDFDFTIFGKRILLKFLVKSVYDNEYFEKDFDIL